MRVEPRKPWRRGNSLSRVLGCLGLLSALAATGCITSYVVSSVNDESATGSTAHKTETSSSTGQDSSNPGGSSATPDLDTASSSESSTESSGTASDASTSSDSLDTLPACPGKKIRCGLLCVDVRNDSQHCGGCFVGCSTPASCIVGECLASCDQGCAFDEECNLDNLCVCKDAKSHCGAECVDLGTDPAHCGACGRACAASQTCVSGQCRS